LVFGAVAEEYDRIRPGYPDRLVDDVLAYARLDGRRALEVGAGTGKATLAFAERGVAVTALEPDPAMAAVLTRRVADRPGITVTVATFEEAVGLPPAGARFDLVYSAQAWHWTDPDTRWARAAAALRPGGALAMFWNLDELADPDCAVAAMAVHARVAPWMDAAAGPVRRAAGQVRPPAGQEAPWPGSDLTARAEFGDVVERRYTWRRHLAVTDYAALLNTHSEYRILDEPTRRRLLDALVVALPPRVELAVATAATFARHLPAGKIRYGPS
jgi:SAM-dependent methyltransferase